MEELFRKHKPQPIGVRNFNGSVKARWAESFGGSWRALIVQDIADSEFVFGENCWIERNLIPIGKCVACLNAEGGVLACAMVSLDHVFDCEIHAVGQTEFYFLRKGMVRTAEMNDVVFVDQARVNFTRRKKIGGREWRPNPVRDFRELARRSANFRLGSGELLG